jgi:hypothetical protein
MSLLLLSVILAHFQVQIPYEYHHWRFIIIIIIIIITTTTTTTIIINIIFV